VKKSGTDEHWERWGDSNPYRGVLGIDSSELSDGNVEARFMESGETHVAGVLETIKNLWGELNSNSALDFGCGVGRLLVPLSKRFGRVTGVDISASMIEHAKQRCPSAQFVQSLHQLGVDEKFDLVHSYIVLQHIRPSQGLPIIEELIERTRPGGVFALHFTVGDSRPRRRILNWARYRLPPIHWAYNLVRKRPIGEPVTEMNEYRLADVIAKMHGKYEGALGMRDFDQNGHVGVMIFGKRST
jgi:SAM-dependent methyltransferase